MSVEDLYELHTDEMFRDALAMLFGVTLIINNSFCIHSFIQVIAYALKTII